MPLVDYDKLFLTADNLRNNAELTEAIKFYVEIAALSTSSNEIAHRARALQMAGVTARQGVTDSQSSAYRDAANFFDEAEKAFQTAQDFAGLGSLYRDRAMLEDRANQLNTAAVWYQKSINQLKGINATIGLATTFDKFGLHYSLTGDNETAVRYLDQAISLLRRESEAGFQYCTALYDLARINFKEKNFEKTVDLAEESLSWFLADHGERQYYQRIAELNGLLSLAYYEVAQAKKAEAAAKEYKKLLKTLDPLAAKVLERDLLELTK